MHNLASQEQWLG